MPKWLRSQYGGLHGWKCEIPGVTNYIGDEITIAAVVQCAAGVAGALERWKDGTSGVLWLTDVERDELELIIAELRYNVSDPDIAELNFQLNEMYDWADAYRFIIGGTRGKEVG